MVTPLSDSRAEVGQVKHDSTERSGDCGGGVGAELIEDRILMMLDELHDFRSQTHLITSYIRVAKREHVVEFGVTHRGL